MNIVSYPNAKINIGLRVLRRRDDGFHDIETLFVPAPLCDILEVVEDKELKIKHYGLSYSLPSDSPYEDLCIKAYKLLKADFDIPPVGIYLYKKIPVGAGLGGGSSDAAFTLKSINTLFSLELDDDTLASYAARLGSDCPFFIYNKPMFGEGRGEVLTPFEAPICEALWGDYAKYRIELKTSSISVSTAQAYGGISPYSEGTPLKELLFSPIREWKGSVVNDFEKSVFAMHPSLEEAKREFYDRGAVFSLMSGSGSTVYGIFEK